MLTLTREAEEFLASSPTPTYGRRPSLAEFSFEDLEDPDFFHDYEAGAFDQPVSQSASNIAIR